MHFLHIHIPLFFILLVLLLTIFFCARLEKIGELLRENKYGKSTQYSLEQCYDSLVFYITSVHILRTFTLLFRRNNFFQVTDFVAWRGKIPLKTVISLVTECLFSPSEWESSLKADRSSKYWQFVSFFVQVKTIK